MKLVYLMIWFHTVNTCMVCKVQTEVSTEYVYTFPCFHVIQHKLFKVGKSEHSWACTKIKSLYISYHWSEIDLANGGFGHPWRSLNIAKFEWNIWDYQYYWNLFQKKKAIQVQNLHYLIIPENFKILVSHYLKRGPFKRISRF